MRGLCQFSEERPRAEVHAAKARILFCRAAGPRHLRTMEDWNHRPGVADEDPAVPKDSERGEVWENCMLVLPALHDTVVRSRNQSRAVLVVLMLFVELCTARTPRAAAVAVPVGWRQYWFGKPIHVELKRR